MQKSLVIQRRPGIGDLCLFLPFIHKIAKNLNFKKIDLITSSRSKSNQILYDDPYVDNIINYENFKGINGSFKLINFLRKNKYSNIFIMHYGIRYKILAKIAGIKKIYSYSNLKTSNSIVDDITNFTNLWTKDNSKHICKIYFNNHENKKNQIVIGIGGSGKNKKWSTKNYIDLIKKISGVSNSSFLIACGKDEAEDARLICKALKKNDLSIYHTSDDNVKTVIDKIRGSKMFVGNDTGFMHISGLLGIKSYGIFGDTPTNYCSYNDIIYPLTPKKCHDITHGSMMMEKINVDDVFSSIERDLIK